MERDHGAPFSGVFSDGHMPSRKYALKRDLVKVKKGASAMLFGRRPLGRFFYLR